MQPKRKVIDLGIGEVVSGDGSSRWWLSTEYLSPETLRRYLEIRKGRDARSEKRRRGKARV